MAKVKQAIVEQQSEQKSQVADVADVAEKKALPSRVKKTLLDPTWFKKTVGLAIKYKSTLIFSDDAVWGVCQNNSSTSFVLFESDDEWCKEVARLFPEGAVFGQHGAADDSDTFRNMRPYAKIDLKDYAVGTAYINPLSGVVHVQGAKASIRSWGFVGCEMTAPIMPDVEMTPVTYGEHVSIDIHKLLTSSVSKNNNGKRFMMYCSMYEFSDGSKHLVGTNGRILTCCPADGLPDGFNFNPDVIDPNLIHKFVHCKNEHDSLTNYYLMNDGVVFCEIIGDIFQNKFNVERVIPSSDPENYAGHVDGNTLKEIVDSICSLGLNNGKFSNTINFKSGKITFSTEAGELASYDNEVTTGETLTMFNLDMLKPFSILKRDLLFSDSNPAISKSDDLTVVIMPLKHSEQ